MKVNFGKIVSISTVDWRGRSACVVFFNRCNFKCIYCQNHELLNKTNLVDIDIIKNKIKEQKNFISAIVFSGGEPTMQCIALEKLAKFSKDIGLLVGIETNGYYPIVLEKLSNKKLVDKIFLDIKTSLLDQKKYSEITGGIVDVNKKVIESLRIQNTVVEARTTVFRFIVDDILDIAKYLKEHDYKQTYVLQQGIPRYAPEEKIRKEKFVSKKELIDIAKNVSSLTGIKIRVDQNTACK